MIYLTFTTTPFGGASGISVSDITRGFCGSTICARFIFADCCTSQYKTVRPKISGLSQEQVFRLKRSMSDTINAKKQVLKIND